MITGLLIFVGVVYLVLLVIANVFTDQRTWDISFTDRVWWFPAEIAFASFGWFVMNVALVAAALIPLVPVALLLWLFWAVSE